MITDMRLVDGARQMSLHSPDGIAVHEFTPGYPEVRDVTEPRADDDGERDVTRQHGASAVAVTLLIYRDQATRIDQLKTFLHPALRPFLHVTDDQWDGERRIRLRADQQSLTLSRELRRVRRVQVSWRAPAGVWEAAVERVDVANADAPATTGVSYPISYPIRFASTVASGEVLIDNPGTTGSHFVARLYGPCNGPRLTLGNSGETIAFTEDLSLGAGDYVEVDTRRRTALLLGNPALPRLSVIDFEINTWWRLLPGGQNQVRYNPISGVDAGSIAEIRWRPQYL